MSVSLGKGVLTQKYLLSVINSFARLLNTRFKPIVPIYSGERYERAMNVQIININSTVSALEMRFFESNNFLVLDIIENEVFRHIE